MGGEAQGVRFARQLTRFYSELENIVPNASVRLSLFQSLHELDTLTRQLNMTTANLGMGSAHLFLTPDNLNLRLAVASASGQTVVDDDSGTYSLPPPPPASPMASGEFGSGAQP